MQKILHGLLQSSEVKPVSNKISKKLLSKKNKKQENDVPVKPKCNSFRKINS